ncbi:MAG: PQQ-dependent sugar dehydrogenase [Balneolaceae bacterium]|nr:PQQ-dependent sugar dehydrogenase [Balneolaceae bacterium]
MKPLVTAVTSLILTASLSCSPSSDSGDNPPPDVSSFQVVEAFPGLSFERPLDLQHPGDGSNRLFVVEQRGMIHVFDNDPSVAGKTTFLDIQNQVTTAGNEEGLLGLAFHPNFENNGFFFVNYTADNPERTVISRFTVSPNDPDQADPASETEILTFSQPFDNHNGGQLAFGPDGYLYISVGDGGSGGDPNENGQDRTTILGTILRIDVDNQANGNNYAIPPDNPYAGNNQGFREEIWAYGLRNPWRFSFDATTGDLWAGDVGQGEFEEVDLIEKGENYGWDIMEGNECFEPSSNCDMSGLTMPIWVYDHSQGDISITGGFVYRGETHRVLRGMYIYADFASGRIWALDITDLDNPVNTQLVDANFLISSFGVDPDNELYICGFDGMIYQLAEEGL